MHARLNRWEHGSDFAFPDIEIESDRNRPTWNSWFPAASYWHSGRDALRVLLQSLAQKVKVKRVLFPSFYCQDVLDAAAEGVEILSYAHDPDRPDAAVELSNAQPGDVVVVANTFGLMRRSPIPDGVVLPREVIVVEDHTHDPFSTWAAESTAHYAFASLRKWLPLPDGGVLWSPRGETVPSDQGVELAERQAKITLERLSAMILKQRYLAGEDAITKDAYRPLALAGENGIGHSDRAPMSPIARSMLETFPVARWRERRRANHQRLVGNLSLSSSATTEILSRTNDPAVTPFACVLAFAAIEQRERVRERLVRANVYPAVLWPIDKTRAPGIRERDLDISGRSLCVHCDHRYDDDDMDRVGEIVRTSLDESDSRRC